MMLTPLQVKHRPQHQNAARPRPVHPGGQLWEKQAAALVLADFEDAINRADADLFADAQTVGHVCAAWDAAVC